MIATLRPEALGEARPSSGAAESGLGRLEALAALGVSGLVQTFLVQINLIRRLGAISLSHLFSLPVSTPAPVWATATLSGVFLCLVVLNYWRGRSRETLVVVFTLVLAMCLTCLAILVFSGFWVTPAPLGIIWLGLIAYFEWRRPKTAGLYAIEGLHRLQRETGIGGSPSRPTDSRAPQQSTKSVAVLQQEFLDARRFWSDLFTTVQNPVLVLDQDGIIQSFNVAAEDFGRRFERVISYGASLETLAGVLRFGSTGEAFSWPPDDGNRFGSPPQNVKLNGVDPDGRAYELSFTPTTDSRDNHTGWIVHFSEITVRNLAMREREVAVQQREDALQFLSHDIRTPQLAILAVLEHADFQRAPAGLSHRIGQQARRTLDLADGFVRLIQAETASPVREEIDLGHILEDATDSVWEVSQSAGVTVRLERWQSEAVVLGDRGLISRAIVNILDNAIKFSAEGQVVTCRLSRAEIDGVPAVACEIEDKAGGMSQSQLSGLFSRYGTFRRNTSGQHGTGLGLAFVQAVVNRHDGHVTCESTLGVGSLFRLTLPRYNPELTAVEAMVSRVTGPEGRGTSPPD